MFLSNPNPNIVQKLLVIQNNIRVGRVCRAQLVSSHDATPSTTPLSPFEQRGPGAVREGVLIWD